MRLSSEPAPLAAGLGSVMRSLTPTDASAVAGVFRWWDDAVGASIAAHARPVKLDTAVLIVEVDEPAWATQLRYLERDLIARLAEVGRVHVERIEIRVKGARPNRRRGAR